jgi:drug/metabolite transporter (DMT)-like permease
MKNNSGIYYMIFSVLAFAMMNTIVKYLSDFNVYQIVFFRSIGTLFFTIPLLLKYQIPMLGNNKKLLILRGALGVFSLSCFFATLNYLAVGTAVSLRYTSPIFAAIFAAIFLKEKIKPLQWLLFIIAFIGVLIIKGFGTEIRLTGLLFALLSSISLGLIFVIIRKIGTSEHPLVIINYFMIIAFIFGGALSIPNWTTPSGVEWILLLSLGIFGYAGQLYMTKAFQLHETSTVAPLKYLEVLFMVLIGAFWFEEVYSLWTLFGIFLILLGLIYNLFLKQQRS